MTDIAERLRLYARHFEDLHAPQNVTIGMREAADEIERLRAEVKKHSMDALLATDGNLMLDEENKRLRAALENIQQARVLQAKEIVDAANEIERLRAALEEVKDLVFGANHSETRYPLARAALEGPRDRMAKPLEGK